MSNARIAKLFWIFSIIFNVKDPYSKYAIKIKIPIVFSREDIEWIKSPLDFGRKGEK